MTTRFYEQVYFFKDIPFSNATMLTLNKGRNQSRRQYDILEMDSKPDARSKSHKIANALNKQSLTKTIPRFASASGYKCQLLLQTYISKLFHTIA